jgi:uncharacterized Ntn-hydrolase superfamily protein
MPESYRRRASRQSRRPAGTYSIVAYDPQTEEMGIAVQSHWFSVGASVAWAAAGVGAVATQSFIDPSYGPLGLNLMKAGKSAAEVLTALLAGDPNREVRQVAMVDVQGETTVHTGNRCIQAAGHLQGSGYSVQANMMASEAVWPAMQSAYEKGAGDLADRMMSALTAAEAAGGDVRGRQSAALLVVKGGSPVPFWMDRRFDLRVDDHPQPLQELKRLLNLGRVYEHMNRGDELATAGKTEAAGRHYRHAAALAPDRMEPQFWYAIDLAVNGKLEIARPLFETIFSREPGWRLLLQRLPAAGLFPDDRALLGELLTIGTK